MAEFKAKVTVWMLQVLIQWNLKVQSTWRRSKVICKSIVIASIDMCVNRIDFKKCGRKRLVRSWRKLHKPAANHFKGERAGILNFKGLDIHFWTCGVSRKVQVFLLWKIMFQSKALCSRNMGKWRSPCLSSHLPKVQGKVSEWLNYISASNCPSHRKSIECFTPPCNHGTWSILAQKEGRRWLLTIQN